MRRGAGAPVLIRPRQAGGKEKALCLHRYGIGRDRGIAGVKRKAIDRRFALKREKQDRAGMDNLGTARVDVRARRPMAAPREQVQRQAGTIPEVAEGRRVAGVRMRHEGIVHGQAGVTFKLQIKAIPLDQREDALDIGKAGKRHVGINPGDAEEPAEMPGMLGAGRLGGDIPAQALAVAPGPFGEFRFANDFHEGPPVVPPLARCSCDRKMSCRTSRHRQPAFHTAHSANDSQATSTSPPGSLVDPVPTSPRSPCRWAYPLIRLPRL